MKKILLCLFFIFFIFSCSNDIENIPNSNPVEKGEMKLEFKGKLYTSIYSIDDNGDISFDNIDFKNIYDEILSFPNYSLLFEEDGTIKAYEDFESMEADNYLNNNETKSVKWGAGPTTITPIILNIFEHENYFGRMISFYSSGNLDIPDLGQSHNFNDMMTSFYLNVASYRQNDIVKVTFYRNENYRGPNITFKAHTTGLSTPPYTYRGSVQCSNIGRYKCTWRKNWNDEISSIKIHY